MKVVVAVDSFKGSMTSMEAGMAVKEGILAAKKDAEVVVKPLADGGEGTTDALIEGLKGERVDVTVTGPYHEPVQAYYGYLRESNTAVMEMATAAGITLSDKKDPMTATTCGVGELILHAISRGIRNFIIGIGGSATNDGGVGMLKALGYKFLDEKGENAGEGGQALAKIVSVEISDAPEKNVAYALAILQGARARKSKAEYIACPSCGRTLYNIQEAVAKIEKATSHLKDVTIAVMGCIVNGPGEMADADFGYVGGAPGKINLYKGKKCIEVNIPQEQSIERLVEFIKAEGKWVEPDK